MKTTVIHHGGCFDGVAGAWVIRKMLREDFVKDDSVTYHPAHYGEAPPLEIDGSGVIIVDFSYPRPVMENIIRRAHHVSVIDHHKTAEAALKDLQGADVNFDMNKSGAGLAWDLLMKGPRPLAIDYVEDRDLWKFRFDGTKPFIAALASMDLTMDNFEKGVEDPERFVQKGRLILDYIATFGKKACEHVVVRDIAGWSVPVINVPYMNSSDHLDMLQDAVPGYKFYAYFFLTKHGTWQFGLRSRGEFDVSEVAKRFGGGGHKNAAGFTVQFLPWDI